MLREMNPETKALTLWNYLKQFEGNILFINSTIRNYNLQQLIK